MDAIVTITALLAIGAALTAWRLSGGLGRLRLDLERLSGDVGRLRFDLEELDDRFAAFDRRETERADDAEARSGAPFGEASSPEATAPPQPQTAAADASAASAEPVATAAAPGAARPPAPRARSAVSHWEQLLVENWLVWLGAAALALGGAFLVKLSIDHGLLTPVVRVVLGIALGLALSAGAEWVRRREASEEGASTASYVPQALAAAGAATIFSSLYAAHALYALLPAGFAFLLLAVTAGTTVAQSLRHGPLVAALGLVGAYVVPLLVTTPNPHALPLFAYLVVTTAGALAVLRHRAWWWLAWLPLAGAMLWVPLWLASARNPEGPIVAGYLLVQFGLFVALRRGVPRVAFLAGIAQTPLVRNATRAALWAIAAGLLFAVDADDFGIATTAAALLLMIGLMALAYRDEQLDDAIAAAGALALSLLASWDLRLPIPDLHLLVFQVQPNYVRSFATAAIVYALLLGGGGFVALPRVPRPGRWAALSAAAPLLILIIAYWRLQNFHLDIAWTLTALALAAAELAAAAAVARRRTGALETEIALAAYAVGVLGSTITAAAFGFAEAWLTIVLALHLPAIGWVESRIRLPALRWAALAIAAIVLARLIVNPDVLDYPLGTMPVFNWLLYGYGIPAAAFVLATRQFGASRDDALVWVLEAGSILFSFMLLSLELVHAIYGRLDVDPFADFVGGAALIALWHAFAAAVIRLGDYRQRPVLRWGGRLLLFAATPMAVFWQLFMLTFGQFLFGLFASRVGYLAILDALLLADAVPALCYAAIARFCPPGALLRPIARIAAAAFAFAWVTLEIRHLFQGEVSLFAASGEAEWYAYSLAWLAFAGAALALGLVRRNEWLRRVGLIGVGLVIAKVFLSDMAELSGVLRALSFLGLGGALVALGYAYRRLRPLQQQP
ncbi:MAG TPA: DUF2339 domain-containing protein [Stellaceae bacterium]|nr:DUF2339 domain-containing protein [Stellaceae bacterium]